VLLREKGEMKKKKKINEPAKGGCLRSDTGGVGIVEAEGVGVGEREQRHYWSSI
jgi:hypothetical protein